ncbi:hypothetical protein ACFL6E_07425, partial [Candidatus Neomarinimicrobiota bacterium]
LLRSSVRSALYMGPYVGIYTGGDEYSYYSSIKPTRSNSWPIEAGVINQLDYGIAFGGEYAIAKKIKIDCRFTVGLRTIESVHGDEVMNNVFQLMGSYSLE